MTKRKAPAEQFANKVAMGNLMAVKTLLEIVSQIDDQNQQLEERHREAEAARERVAAKLEA
jgi:hypothetical protein